MITGAARGVGPALTETNVRHGAKVAVADCTGMAFFLASDEADRPEKLADRRCRNVDGGQGMS